MKLNKQIGSPNK